MTRLHLTPSSFLLLIYATTVVSGNGPSSYGFTKILTDVESVTGHVDFCVLDNLTRFLSLQNSLRNTLVIIKPEQSSLISFEEYFEKISTNGLLWPYTIYGDSDKSKFSENNMLLMFISSPFDLRHPLLDRLRNLHMKIYIVYSDLGDTNVEVGAIQPIYYLLPKKEFNFVVLFVQKGGKATTCRIFTPSNFKCRRVETDLQSPSSNVNQHGKCVLNVLVTIKEPFILYDIEKGFYGGIEIFLLKTLSEKLNIDLKFIINDGSDIDDVDIIIGGIPHTSAIKSGFVSTTPYYSDDITWCINCAKDLPLWMNVFFYVSDIKLYFLAPLLFFYLAFQAYLISSFEDKPVDFFKICLITTVILTCISTHHSPTTVHARLHQSGFYFITMWLINVVGAYFLQSMMNRKQRYQTKSVYDLFENSFQLSGDLNVFEKISQEPRVNIALMLNLHKFWNIQK